MRRHWPMWGAIAAILLLPLIAMRFTSDVAWTGSDFVAAGLLLIGAGAAFEVASRRPGLARHRAVIGAALLAAVSLIWAQGAVGII